MVSIRYAEIQRDRIIDLIKGIGIILMVYRHAHGPFSEFVLLFHMAVFFMASGYLYDESKINSSKDCISYLIRKVRGLWFPYFCYAVFFILCNNLFIRLNIYTDNPLILSLEGVDERYRSITPYLSFSEELLGILKAVFFRASSGLGGALWFLGTLFFTLTGYAIVDYVIKIYTRNYGYKVWFCLQGSFSIVFLLIGYCSKIFQWDLIGLNNCFTVYCLVFIGNIIHYYSLMDVVFGKDKKSRRIGLVIILAMASLIYLFHRGYIGIAANEITNPLYFVTVSLLGWMLLYGLSIIIDKTRFRDFFAYIGRNTVCIVALHFLSFKIVNYIAVFFSDKQYYKVAAFPVLRMDKAWWVGYLLVGVAVPLLINEFLKLCISVWKFDR